MSVLHLVAHAQAGAARAHALPVHALLEGIFEPVRNMPQVRPAHCAELLYELGELTARLLELGQGRGVVPFDADQEVWECGLEVCGSDLLLSLFRSSPGAFVLQHERRIGLRSFVDALLGAIQRQVPAGEGASSATPALRPLLEVAARLRALDTERLSVSAPRVERELSAPAVAGLRLLAAGKFRSSAPVAAEAQRVERADLHSLLMEGQLVLEVRSLRVQAPSSQLFLDAERLVQAAQDVLTTWETGRVQSTRVTLSQLSLSFYRTRSDGPLELSIRGPERELPKRRVHVVRVESLDWVRSTAQFACALVDTFAAADPEQLRNLRLSALRQNAERLIERANAEDESITNSKPESYRRFVRQRRSMANGKWERGGQMRFSARWVATVPGLDLRATFLCGDCIVVDSSRETACIERTHGKILWRIPSGPAGCTVSPAGLIRLRPDGMLSSVDLATGKTRFNLQLKPRAGGGAAGSLVHSAGLPKILALTEGDRQVSAVDLISGQVRWRHTTSRPGAYRLRRVGKLLLATGGSNAIFALDLATGEAVWRLHGRLPFTGALAVDPQSVMAISGAPGTWLLQHIDPWTGQSRWCVELGDTPLPGKHPLVTAQVVVVPVGSDQSAGAEAYDRATGKLLWKQHSDLATATSAWLAFDEAIIINDAAGILLCLDAQSGRPLFNHVFAGNCEADAPRRLEPVLRNGALFVPQQQVHVVRPRTGEIIGAVPPDYVPDLLRIDERCDVYIGEESGHLAAFGAAPRLALVNPADASQRRVS
jgi:outer membrane protein assembly factor BamB